MLLSRILRSRYDVVHSSAHFDLTALMWPLPQKVIQTFHAPPDPPSFAKRIRLIPRKNLWFTTVGKHMVPALQPIAPTRGIHNGIRIKEFTYQANVPADAPLVFLGRIERIKGTHNAIRIARETGRRLVIAGNRSDDALTDRYFKEEVEPHLSERITYLGPVDSEAKNRLLGGAAAFLMPIEWDEPFGLVMAEALACGTPVIAIGRGAVPEIVEHGVTGACCGSVEEMVTAVQGLDRLSRLACRQAAEAKFSTSVMLEQYLRFYEDVLNGTLQRPTSATPEFS